jgi:hypothetical protein
VAGAFRYDVGQVASLNDDQQNPGMAIVEACSQRLQPDPSTSPDRHKFLRLTRLGSGYAARARVRVGSQRGGCRLLL